MFYKVPFVVWPILIPFVEVGATILLTKTLGAVITYSLFAISNLIGLILLWFQWQKIKPYWEEIKDINQLDEEEKAKRSADPLVQKQMMDFFKFILSAVLLLIPGFVTDLVAFYFISVLTKDTPASTPQVD